MKIDKSGFYLDVPEADYHADPCPEPSWSASFIKTLVSRTPRHAWATHPRLNPAFEPENKTVFDIGSAAHAVMLHDDRDITVLPFENYRKKEAQQARDEAYADGAIPLLEEQWEHVKAMVAAGRAQIAAHEDIAGAFEGGDSEVTLVWKEGDLWCRCRVDWVPPEGSSLPYVDYKTTTNAHPDAWGQRQMYDLGADITAAWYRRGIAAVFGIHDADYRFVVSEKDPPYCLSVCAPTPAAIHMADRKVNWALKVIRWCMETGQWPGYPARTCYVDPPAWHEKSWIDFENHVELIGDRKLFDQLAKWQEPQ